MVTSTRLAARRALSELTSVPVEPPATSETVNLSGRGNSGGATITLGRTDAGRFVVFSTDEVNTGGKP